CLDPLTTPYFSSFPNSTIAIQGSGSYYDYYLASASQLTWLGSANSSTTNILQHPQVFLQYPFQFTDTFVDSHYDTSGTGTHTFTHSRTQADSYGTLNLPIGTFNNVLRVHTLSTTIDSATTDTTLIEDTYFFYTPGYHAPIFEYLKYDFIFMGTHYPSYVYAI